MLTEEITAKDAKELHNRYAGTFGFLPKADGSRIAVKIGEIGHGYASVSDSDGNWYRLNCDQGTTLEFTQVKSGWYEFYPGMALLIMRRPERQWKRGICQENTYMWSFNKNGKLVDAVWDGSTIQQLFYPSPNYDYTPTGLDVKVLNKFFAIGQGKVYLKNNLIGEFSNGVVKLEDDLFQQELHDAFVRNNIAVTFAQ